MLTLREALQLPILKDAKVVASASGLDEPIRWVHNAGAPDAARWLHGGELVLTTVYNMPASAAEQGDYLRQLAEKGIVALVITIGMLVDEIPRPPAPHRRRARPAADRAALSDALRRYRQGHQRENRRR